MNSTIKTFFSTCCVTVACLALVACGGGSDDAGNGNGGSGDNSTASGGGSSEANDSPAYQVVDDFVTHMANREFGEARELVRDGGDSSKLDGYIEGMDVQMMNPATSQFLDPMFAPVIERFAAAGIEVVSEEDQSAVVRVTMGEQAYDLDVSSLDGTEWAIELPQGFLTAFDQLLMEAMPTIQQNSGSGG